MLIQNDFRRRTKTNGLQMRLNLGEGVEEGGSGYSRNFGWGVPLGIPTLKQYTMSINHFSIPDFCKQETPNLHTIDQCPINDTLYKPISSDFYPLFRPNCFKKTLPDVTANTYLVHIWQCPPPPGSKVEAYVMQF